MDQKKLTDLNSITTFAVIGSRNFESKSIVKRVFETHISKFCKRIISGGAKGADTLAANIADEYGIATHIIRPEWKTKDGKYNPRAGFDRNTDIIEQAEGVWAFWNLYSNGTFDSICTAHKNNKPVWITTPINETFKLSPLWYFSKYLYLIERDKTLTLEPAFTIDPSKHSISYVVSKLHENRSNNMTCIRVLASHYKEEIKYFDRLRSTLSSMNEAVLLVLDNIEDEGV